jgi:hypothetical protein
MYPGDKRKNRIAMDTQPSLDTCTCTPVIDQVSTSAYYGAVCISFRTSRLILTCLPAGW